jgi:fatty-acyl-CoA synthase
VRTDRIHGSLHHDPLVFNDELERIWYRDWVYIGHESEVPESGTYVRKPLGLQPAVLTRDGDGEIHVLFNRCSHLANLVCHEQRGAAAALRCPFHGWTFGLDGRLLGVPFNQGYGPDFDKTAHGLAAPPRVAAYRGFVFASMRTDGPDLLDHLGHAAAAIDRLCALSPEGEIELTAGWLQHRTDANWKIGYEAALDGYHPRFVHRALISLTPGTPFELGDESSVSVRALGNGHGDVDSLDYYRQVDMPLIWVASTPEKMPRYVQALEHRHGRDEARRIMVDGPPHVAIFPNLFIADQFIMVLNPLGPTCHVQAETPIQWKGGEELNVQNLRQTGASIGPAGMVLADDVAMMERNQRGLESRQPEWMLRSRGSQRREPRPDGTVTGKLTDDVGILGFWSHYLSVMEEA